MGAKRAKSSSSTSASTLPLFRSGNQHPRKGVRYECGSGTGTQYRTCVCSQSSRRYEGSMRCLKEYLEEGNGSSQSEVAELVPYFALPYIPNPRQHPLFKDLCQVPRSFPPQRNADWKSSLQEKWGRVVAEKLDKFLASKSPASTSSKPKLVTLLHVYQNPLTFAFIHSTHGMQDSKTENGHSPDGKRLEAAEKAAGKYRSQTAELQVRRVLHELPFSPALSFPGRLPQTHPHRRRAR